MRSRPADGTVRRTPPAVRPAHREWVLVSAGRTQRPWQGLEEDEPAEERPAYDPTCYLCPGNARASGDVNPAYDRDVSCSPTTSRRCGPNVRAGGRATGLLRAEGERGTCRVVCFSPRHDLTLAGDDARRGPRGGRRLGGADRRSSAGAIRWVQVFENRGEAMGASNPHPHGQIWAGDGPAASRRPARTRRSAAICDANGRPLLLDYARQEQRRAAGRGGERRVAGRRAVLGRLAVRDAA